MKLLSVNTCSCVPFWTCFLPSFDFLYCNLTKLCNGRCPPTTHLWVTGDNAPAFDAFVTKWVHEVHNILRPEPVKPHHDNLQKFYNSLMHYEERGTFQAVHMNWCLLQQNQEPSNFQFDPKKQKRTECKATLAQ